MKDLNDVEKWVRLSLAFHNLNKAAETKLGISLVQYHLLSVIRSMPASCPQLVAHRAGMHPSSLTQGLKRLQRKGYVFADEDPRDSRKKIITLSLKGKSALESFEDRFSELQKDTGASGALAFNEV